MMVPPATMPGQRVRPRLRDPCPDPDDADGDDRRYQVKKLWMDPVNKDGNRVERVRPPTRTSPETGPSE